MQRPIVVKIGSSSLTSANGNLYSDKIHFFAAELISLQDMGYPLIVVTSGAIAAGFKNIGYTKRPHKLHEKQAAAAVGQVMLMQAYYDAFHSHQRTMAQILLTRSDFSNRRMIRHALTTIEELIRHQVVPIINENDTVSVDEIKFGDNDMLSALVANLVKAQKLLIITDTDGLYTDDPRKNKNAERIHRVDHISEQISRIAGGAGTPLGTGGMHSKIEAARIAMRGGVPVFIGRALQAGDIKAIVRGDGKGTYFDTSQHNLSTKKQWVGYHSIPRGQVLIDLGAEKALMDGGKSLLPAGLIAVSGEFHPGDVIEVLNEQKEVIGRGVVNYASWQLRAVAGLSTAEVRRRVEVQRIEVVHRDEWMPFAR